MIDFEEDVPLSDAQRLQQQVQDIAKGVQQALDTASKGRLLKSGLQVGTCLSTPVQRTRVWSYAVCTPCCRGQVISAVRVTTCSDRQILKHCIQQCWLQHADGVLWSAAMVVVACGTVRSLTAQFCKLASQVQSVKPQWHKQTTSRQGDNQMHNTPCHSSFMISYNLGWLALSQDHGKSLQKHTVICSQPESVAYQQ